jgi:hypothetical protein
MSTEKEIGVVFTLLQESATIADVSQFLKSRGITHSAGNWPDLLEKRLRPALANDDLKRADLLQLLAISEEYGKQHVFLYKTSVAEARELLREDSLRRTLKKLEIEYALDQPKILARSSKPTITEIRIETSDQLRFMVIKAVEERTYQQFVDELHEGEYVVRRYKEIRMRAVNVARLHDSGLLELCLASHLTATGDYKNDLNRFWIQLTELLPQRYFSAVPITQAKRNLWSDRKALKSHLRYSDSRLRNKQGTVLSAASGSEQTSLFDDEGASESLDTFLQHNAYCDSSNTWWLRSNSGVPSKDVHVLMSGQPNEFAVTGRCSKQDYEYVLGKIREHN